MGKLARRRLLFAGGGGLEEGRVRIRRGVSDVKQVICSLTVGGWVRVCVCVCLCAWMCDFMPSEEASKQVCVSTIVKEKVNIWD